MNDLSSLVDALAARMAQEINAVRTELYNGIGQVSGGGALLTSSVLLSGGGATLDPNNVLVDGGGA